MTEVGIWSSGDDFAGIDRISLRISSVDGGGGISTNIGPTSRASDCSGSVVEFVTEMILDDVLDSDDFVDEEMCKAIAQFITVVGERELSVSSVRRRTLFRIADQRLRGSTAAVCMRLL